MSEKTLQTEIDFGGMVFTSDKGRASGVAVQKPAKPAWAAPKIFPLARMQRRGGTEYWFGGYADVSDCPRQKAGAGYRLLMRALDGVFVQVRSADVALARDRELAIFSEVFR